VKRKLIGVVATSALALGLLGVGASSASAVTASDFCFDNLRSHTELAAVLPSKALNCQLQAGPARAYGYTGTVEGKLGVNSWKGIQGYLKAKWGYAGPINGIPGKNTYEAIQRAANTSGLFDTPVKVDGTLALKDWRGWAYRVRMNFFSN
jgi:hypothetical protein